MTDIKKGDFIELEYTGRVADTKEAFDTTSEAVAKKEGIFSPKTKYGDIIIVLGEGHLIRGLETRLEGKPTGKHTFEIPDVEAFGKKTTKKLKLMPAKSFKSDQIRPYPGLQINVDGEIGIVKTVSGGRIIVDFNHPLSSKDIIYEVNVRRIVSDKKEQIESLFQVYNLPVEEIIVEGEKVTIKTKVEYPAELTGHLTSDIKRLIAFKEVNFEKK